MLLAEEIEARMSVLVGLPLWDLGRAYTLAWFQFGPRKQVTAKFGPRAGISREVGSHALHLQCSWRIATADGKTFGSAELEEPASADFDIEAPPGGSLLDVLSQEFVHDQCPAVVLACNADSAGAFVLALSGGHTLEVTPDSSSENEQWRILCPYQPDPHFVFKAGGLAEE